MTKPARPSLTVDVIVVGAGLAGVVAALTAAESGAAVSLLEKGCDFGGSSVRAGGGLLFAGTDLQASMGVEDDGEKLRRKILATGRDKCDPVTVDVYINHQLDTYHWLRGRGVEFDLTPTGTSETSRMHATPKGYLVRFLHERFAALGGTEYWASTPVRQLVTDTGGRVTGVVATSGDGDITLSARQAVVLTSGGFARSRQLLETFAPAWVDAVKMSGVDNTGDGLRMAWALGAAVADMGYIEASFGASIKNYPDLTDSPADEPRLLYPNSQGAVIVNLDGRRFVDEGLNYKIISGICARQPAGIGFQLFDEKVMGRSRPNPSPADWKDGFAQGFVVRADTITELAERLLIDPATLQATIETYNRYADEGADPEFGRTVHDYGTPGGGRIDTAPFYAFPCRNGLTTTYCGLRVNGRLQVLDVFDQPIEGLFAAGEVVGGFHGAGYLSGTGLGKAAVFGRAAGQECIRRPPLPVRAYTPGRPVSSTLSNNGQAMTSYKPDFHDVLDGLTDPVDSPEVRAKARELLRGWFSTTHEKDLDGVRALMAENIQIEIPFSESGRTEDGHFRVYEGIEAACGFWATAFQAEGESAGPLGTEITQSADGRVTFVEARGHLTMANGRDYRNRYVMRFVIENGKIAHVREYYNPIVSGYAFRRQIAGQFVLDSLEPNS